MSLVSITNVEPWDISELIESFKVEPINKKRIIIPKYQRNLVWNKEQKKMLIDSIKAWLPIGAVLLYNDGADENGNNTYQLIDGLQRLTSIKKYTEKPTEYFDVSNLPEDFVVGLKKLLDQNNISIEEDAVNNFLVEWVRQLLGFTESNWFSSARLAYHLDEKTGEKLEKSAIKKLTEFCTPFLEKIQKDSNISFVKIPVIIYSGPKENLPTIFERLNSKWTQLTKYQVFAATWSTYSSFKINNKQIITKIKEKYDSLIEEGLEIDNYDESSFFDSEFNYFELFFWLWKYLSANFPSLFWTPAAEDETDSIGFTLWTLCILDDHDLKKMKDLPKKLKNIDIDNLIECIEDAVRTTHEILKPYIWLRANKKNGFSYPVVHSELQIASIIGKIFACKYQKDLSIKSTWTKDHQKLKQNIPFHYLYDILRGYWSGTGDSKAAELVKNEQYLTPIDKENWDLILNIFKNWEHSKKEKARVNIKSEMVLFLKYIYAHVINAHEELSTIEFEVEHICPVTRLKNVASLPQIDGLPIWAISNLALIKKSLNREKNDKTFYEYFDEELEDKKLTETEYKRAVEEIEKLIFVERSDLEFMSSFGVQNVDEYNNFLEKRFSRLKTKFYQLNNIK